MYPVSKDLDSGTYWQEKPGTVEITQKQIQKDIRRVAMNMLARREYSCKELEQKLSVKFVNAKQDIVIVVGQLQSEGLQSDLRFSEGYLRWRAGKGFGVERIGMELNQKGVDEDIICRAIESVEIDWDELLKKQYQKKYLAQPPETQEQKAKYIRFFLYRGFSHNQIRRIIAC